MQSFSATDIGMSRKINQDFVFCEENAIGNLPNLFIVADGMGGHKAGDYASRYSVQTAAASIRESKLKTPVGILEEAIGKANTGLLEEAAGQSDLEGMGTTFVAATILDDTMYVANIGDSRLYRIRNDIRQVTEDHSLVAEMVKKGELEADEIRTHPNKNIITRAMGAEKDIAADYFEVEVCPLDLILLCSDGLSNMLEDQEILRLVQKEEDLQTLARELIERANECGGKDNISVIIIRV